MNRTIDKLYWCMYWKSKIIVFSELFIEESLIGISWQIVTTMNNYLARIIGEKSLVKINPQYKIPETLLECSVNFLREFRLVLIISIINMEKDRLSIVSHTRCWKVFADLEVVY